MCLLMVLAIFVLAIGGSSVACSGDVPDDPQNECAVDTASALQIFGKHVNLSLTSRSGSSCKLFAGDCGQPRDFCGRHGMPNCCDGLTCQELECCVPEDGSCKQSSECCSWGKPGGYQPMVCSHGKCQQMPAARNGEPCSVEGMLVHLAGCEGEHSWATCEAQQDGRFRCVTREGHKCDSSTLCERGGTCINGKCGFHGACRNNGDTCGFGHAGCCGGNTWATCSVDGKCCTKWGHKCTDSTRCCPGLKCVSVYHGPHDSQYECSDHGSSSLLSVADASTQRSQLSGLTQWPVVMTHESSSFYLAGNNFKLSDQNVSLDVQLDLGARALDIRPAMDPSNYEIYFMHGAAASSKTLLQEGLQQVKDWIDEHPSEFVVLAFQDFGSNLLLKDIPKELKRQSTLIMVQNMFGRDRVFSDNWDGARSCSDFHDEVATDKLRGVYAVDNDWRSCLNSNYNDSITCKNSHAIESPPLPKCEQDDWKKMDDYIANHRDHMGGLNVLQLHFQGFRAKYTERAFCVNKAIATRLRDPENVAAFKGRPIFIQIDHIAHDGRLVVEAVEAMKSAL